MNTLNITRNLPAISRLSQQFLTLRNNHGVAISPEIIELQNKLYSVQRELSDLRERVAATEARSLSGFIHIIPDEDDERIRQVTLAARSLPVITPDQFQAQLQERLTRVKS